ncbi:odorant receptor 13a-like [Solenopsis invicta]|uniref:odorant receptor 13a-like n=1 Tax=Solenopsis invicta TaxID=13686 RepID=UPI00193D5C79|nr:odorant receptor 13a-like [Solenopsis invicta]
MSFYDNRYYHSNKIVLSLVGQWPFQSRIKSSVMFASTVLVVFTMMALVLWGLISGITDITIVMENMSPLLVNNFVIIKLMNCLYNKYKMKELLERIEKTWKIMHVGHENTILRLYAEESRKSTVRYIIALYSAWIFYCVTPIVVNRISVVLPTNNTHTPKFLYRLEHVIDMHKYYNLLMLHGSICVFYTVSVIIAIDCFFVLCTQHACALFKCIKYNVECIGVADLESLNPNVKDDEAYHAIINSIKLYKYALKFADLLSTTYATSFLFTLGNVVISLSFGAAKMIMLKSSFDQIIRIMSTNLAQVLHIYYLSSTSQQLIDHSSELQEVIYSCKWYDISLRSRQLLQFTLLRTTKPCQIEAGKMFTMSMENFSSILKMSLSYFTMIRSLQ